MTTHPDLAEWKANIGSSEILDVRLVEEGGESRERTLRGTAVLRHLPGRRLVVRTDWDGSPAVLKMFIGPGAERYRDRELAGLDNLAAAGARIPERLALVRAPVTTGNHRGGAAAQQVGFVVAYLADAGVLDWQDETPIDELVRLLARLHARGMVHSDPHLDNFLTVAHRLHAVDGDGVRKLGAARSQRSSIRNLGLLLAQLPPVADGRIESLIHSYLEERGWTATSHLLVQCRRELAEQRSDRYRRYLRKCQRDCSEFEVERRAGRYQVSVRADSGRIPAGFFAEPDSLVQSGRMLKDGNSATVVRCEVPDATRTDRLVVKRYNSKGFWHALRRSIEPFPRFRRAWCYGQLLHLLGVPTARPLALCERGPGVFRPRGWLLLEDLGDTHLGEEVAAAGISDARVDEVVGIFSALRAAGLRHGDTKVTNFLIHDGHVHLIDLDAMTLSARGVERDIERFLENWEGQTRERFLKAFQAAGLL